MKRKVVFDAARAEGADFSRPGNIQALDNALTFIGFPVEPPEEGLKPSSKALSLIREFEGCRLKAYPDPGTGGIPWTIGWGSTTDENGAPIKKGDVWTQERADARLRQHVAEFGKKVWQLVADVPTTQNQFDALVSFAYNVGVGNLKSSTLLRRHREKSYAGAALEFARWNMAAGKVLPGLVRRRAAEAELYRTK